MQVQRERGLGEDIGLSAASYGNCYKVMCGMASKRADIKNWQAFVVNTLWPQYRKECHITRVTLPLYEALVAAEYLKDYFEDHVCEQ